MALTLLKSGLRTSFRGCAKHSVCCVTLGTAASSKFLSHLMLRKRRNIPAITRARQTVAPPPNSESEASPQLCRAFQWHLAHNKAVWPLYSAALIHSSPLSLCHCLLSVETISKNSPLYAPCSPPGRNSWGRARQTIRPPRSHVFPSTAGGDNKKKTISGHKHGKRC